jgi:hypothetical protein
VLVLGAISLLITLGRTDLLVILIPLSLLLAFVIGCSKQRETGLTGDSKKG